MTNILRTLYIAGVLALGTCIAVAATNATAWTAVTH